jgi:integrase
VPMPIFRNPFAQKQVPPSTHQCIAEWHNHIIAGESTRHFALTTVSKAFAQRDLTQLTPSGVHALRDEMIRRGALSTRQKRVAAMRGFLLWCAEHDLLPATITTDLIQQEFRPIHAIRHPPAARTEPIGESVTRLVAAATDDRERALVLLALASGWSPARLVQLNVVDVDLPHSQVCGAAFPLVVMEALSAICMNRQPYDPVFRSARHQRLSEPQARRILADLRRQAKIPIPLSRWVHQHHTPTHGIPPDALP